MTEKGWQQTRLSQLQLEGRQVVTLLRSDQYEAEGSFEQIGEWQPWRYNRSGQVICEVAAARFALKRPDDTLPPVEVEVALIRDWRRLLVVEQTDETADDQDWQADLAPQQQRFWEDGWQALPAPPAPTMPKLIPVITTGHGMDAVDLAQTYFQRWKCQENSIRDCAPLRREIGCLPQAGEVESETSRTTPDPTRKLGKGH